MIRRIAAIGAVLVTATAAAQPAPEVAGPDEALSRLLDRMRLARSEVSVERAEWNALHGAYCLRFTARAGEWSERGPLIAAVGRRGAIEAPSRACGPPARPLPRTTAASLPIFVQQVQGNLLRLMSYPLSARERRATGRSGVMVRVHRDGRVLEACVVRSSGHADLDRQALHMARTMTVPHFAAETEGDTLVLRLPIRFALTRHPGEAPPSDDGESDWDDGTGDCGSAVSAGPPDGARPDPA